MELVHGIVPFIAITATMHGINHLYLGGQTWTDPMHGLTCIAMYISLGKRFYFDIFSLSAMMLA